MICSSLISVYFVAVLFATTLIHAAPANVEDCSNLPAPIHGDVQLVFSQTNKLLAVFTCKQGYAAVGDTVLSCENGKWDKVPPLCSSLEGCDLQTSGVSREDPQDISLLKCGKLSSPRYGRMDTKIGKDGRSEIATFNCARGYYLYGSSALHCTEGIWDGHVPDCKPVDCGEPEAPVNGTVEFSDTHFMSKAHYKCNACRVLNGYEHRSCKRSGVWSKTVPECVLEDDISDCSLPELPQGSYIPNKVELLANEIACGQQVHIRCFSGRRLQGSNIATCNSDGSYTWSGQTPVCKQLRWSR